MKITELSPTLSVTYDSVHGKYDQNNNTKYTMWNRTVQYKTLSRTDCSHQHFRNRVVHSLCLITGLIAFNVIQQGQKPPHHLADISLELYFDCEFSKGQVCRILLYVNN